MTKLNSETKRAWLFVALVLVGGATLIYFWPSIQEMFGSEEAIERTVKSWGSLGPMVFLIINVLQVIVAPIPGTAVGVAGGYLFGFWLGFALNVSGILLGSIIAFSLARVFGKPLVDRFVGPHTAQFLERVATKNGVRGLMLMFLVPFLPDDALCLMAGLTPIRLSTFIFIVLLGRSPGSLVSSLTGAGLVDLPLWGWVLVGAASISLVVLWWVRGDEVEARVRKWYAARSERRVSSQEE